jgi:PAS domain S-box-containing protein
MRTIAVRLIVAFSCVTLLLVIQGWFAFHNARSLAEAQRQALAKEMDINDLKGRLSQARLTVFQLLGTMNPNQMDALRTQFRLEIDNVNPRLLELGVPPGLIEENTAAYEKVIQLQYEFHIRSARHFIYSMSKDYHEALVQSLSARADNVAAQSRRQVEDAYDRMLLITGILLVSALLVSLFWAMVLMRNLTDRRQAEKALRESEEKYREIFNSIVDVFYRTDNTGRITLISPSAEVVFGYSVQEMIGRNLASFYVDPGQRADLIEEIRRTGEVRGYEAPLRAKDGAVVWVSTNAHLHIGPDGEVLGVQGVTRDITEQRKAEEERIRLESQLSQSQKMEAVGTLAGGIAHDFNNILSAILGYSELLLLDMPDTDKRRRNIEQVISAATRARDLVQQILTFSRKAQQDRRVVDLGPITKETIKFLRASLPTTIEIRSNVETGHGWVMADATQLHQVLMNLCTNAAHAMGDRGGLLEIELEKKLLDQPVEQNLVRIEPGDYMVVSIRDSGKGISSVDLQRIFEPFFTTKGPGEGTGMGLAVVHGIVKAHGGFITVESEVGLGTVFQVYFPTVPGEIGREEPSDEMPISIGLEKLLFLDDEKALVDIAGKALRRLGYDIVTMDDSLKALQLVKDDPDHFDLVITDQTMPKMTGLELASEIKKKNPRLPVIVCTGYSQGVNQDDALEKGVAALLMKPVSIRELSATVRRVLDASPNGIRPQADNGKGLS